MKEYSKVKIKKNNLEGVIVDIYMVDGTKYFSVEVNEKKTVASDGYGYIYQIFDCTADDLEFLE